MAHLATSHIKHWKTTLLGIVLIATSIAYMYFSEDASAVIFFGCLGIGIVFIFLPDTFIAALRNFVKKNQNKEI